MKHHRRRGKIPKIDIDSLTSAELQYLIALERIRQPDYGYPIPRISSSKKKGRIQKPLPHPLILEEEL